MQLPIELGLVMQSEILMGFYYFLGYCLVSIAAVQVMKFEGPPDVPSEERHPVMPARNDTPVIPSEERHPVMPARNDTPVIPSEERASGTSSGK